MEVRNWFRYSVLPPVASRAIRVFGKSMRLFSVGESTVDELYRQGQRMIIAFWHGRQVMMPLAYRGTRASILISRHRDGELIARIMKSFGFGTIRGSTTRGGIRALRHLISEGRRGGDLVMTPDGPKGPACRVQPGVVLVAKLTGLPIVPLTFACSKKKVLSSWDQFQIPYPGSQGLFVWGEPLRVPQEGTREHLRQKGLLLETQLNRMTRKADWAVLKDDPIQGYQQAEFIVE